MCYDAEHSPTLWMRWKKCIRYRWMLLTFKRRRCFKFRSNRINSLFICLFFWWGCIHKTWNRLIPKIWLIRLRHKMNDFKNAPYTSLNWFIQIWECKYPAKKIPLKTNFWDWSLPFRGQFHVFEWIERNSMCQQFQPKCIRLRKEWNYVHSDRWIEAIETSIEVAILIRLPIWKAKYTWWFQLALSNLNWIGKQEEEKQKWQQERAKTFIYLIFCSQPSRRFTISFARKTYTKEETMSYLQNYFQVYHRYDRDSPAMMKNMPEKKKRTLFFCEHIATIKMR